MALSLMRLADRGIFDPDRPVSEYLPWFSVRSAFGPITGHHLLTHSAGIPSNRDDITSSPYQAFALREQQTAREPGERFLYSNIGYPVLHVSAEELDGRPFERILTESILEPAGMVGFGAFMVADMAASLGAVSLVNGPRSGSQVPRYGLAVAKAIREGTKIPDLPDPSTPPDAGPMENYPGTYTSPGGESSSSETPLFEEAPGVFRIGEEPTPERLRFHDVVDGRALRADRSGHVFFRTSH